MTPTTDTKALIAHLGKAAKSAAAQLRTAAYSDRCAVIREIADRLMDPANQSAVLEANAEDLQRGKELPLATQDRLRLDEARLGAAADGLRTVAQQPDPLGRVLDRRERPNGLKIDRVAVPLGVIGLIYEARPLVTLDATALCLLSGNAVILRPGSDSLESCLSLGRIIESALADAGFAKGSTQIVPTSDRAAVGAMLSGADGGVDVIVPRGGKSLVARVQKESRVPVIGHLEGICHLYIHSAADMEMARDVAVNAKMRRPGICGAMETLLVDDQLEHAAEAQLFSALTDAGCELRVCEKLILDHPQCSTATDEDWSTEYLAPILSVRRVEGMSGAVSHIAKYSTGHTDGIVTADATTAAAFKATVDSAIVMHNCSTQYADGGEFGMGAEIGIATGRLAPRGPVGASELTSYKYVVHGEGQCRP